MCLAIDIIQSFVFSSDAVSEKSHLQQCCEALKAHLLNLNKTVIKEQTVEHINAAIRNIQNGIRYERLDMNGPRHPKVTRKCPLVTK